MKMNLQAELAAPRLLNAKGQRDCRGSDLLSNFLKRVDVEGLSDMIAGKIFEAYVHSEAIVTGLPGNLRRKPPLRFVLSDGDNTADIALWPHNLEHPLQ